MIGKLSPLTAKPKETSIVQEMERVSSRNYITRNYAYHFLSITKGITWNYEIMKLYKRKSCFA